MMAYEDMKASAKLIFSQFLRNVRLVSVEPFLFFFMFGYHVRLVTFQSLLMDRACRNGLNYSAEICDDIQAHKFEHTNAVRYGNNLFVGCVLMATVPAFFISIFVGPWSDKYGRKMPLIIAASGVLIDNSFAAFIASRTNASPTLFLGSQIISGISGGLVVTLSQTYSYLSDITNERTRPTRFAVLEFFFILSTPIGTFIGGQIFDSGGYLTVMIVAPCGFACAVLWAIFMIKETKERDPETTKKQIVRDLFQIKNLKESFKTCTKKRPGNLRLQIWLLVFMSCSIMMVNMGTLMIGFPYASVMFKWGVSEYANTTTGFYIFYAFSVVTLVPMLSRRFMIHEAAMGLVGVFSLMAKMVIMAVSFKRELIYYAWFAGALHACSGIAIRSRMSKLVSKQELGRVFSLLATCEALMPVIGMTIMTRIYNTSLHSYPALPYATASVILIPCAIIFGWMTKLPTMSFVQFQETEELRVMKEMREVSNFM